MNKPTPNFGNRFSAPKDCKELKLGGANKWSNSEFGRIRHSYARKEKQYTIGEQRPPPMGTKEASVSKLIGAVLEMIFSVHLKKRTSRTLGGEASDNRPGSVNGSTGTRQLSAVLISNFSLM